MKCRELAELLVDYVAGDLAPEMAEHIKEHLCECGPCVRFVETYQVTIRLTRQLPCVEVPPELIKRLKAAVADAEMHIENEARLAPESDSKTS